MLLQRQPPARVHDNALDLIAATRVDALVIAPRTIDALVFLRFGTLELLQRFDDILDARRGVRMRDQDRILRRDDDDVAQAHHGGQQAIGAHQAIRAVEHEGVAPDGIAVFVLRAQVAHRRPGADVAPADVGRDDRRATRMLHHGVIDRLLRRGREGRLVENQELQVAPRLGDGFGAGVGHRGFELHQLVAHRRRRKDEIAGIPVIALVDIGLRRRRIGLFDESRDLEGVVADRGARPDVAVPGFGMRGLDAQRHDLALAGGMGGLLAFGDEAGGVLHDVIRSHHDDDRLGIARQGELGRDRHRGTRVAAHGLQHHFGVDAGLRELLGDEEPVGMIGDHDRPGEGRGFGEDSRDGLEGRLLAEQAEELLGKAFPRFRATCACPRRHT